MGFFSGIFGTKNEWAANNFVSSTVGKKFWHKSFIDLDEMRNYGIHFGFQLMPTAMSLNESQSPKTIIGEMIFLFKQCEASNDDVGISAVIQAIARLVNEYEKILPEGSRALFISECFSPELLELLEE